MCVRGTSVSIASVKSALSKALVADVHISAKDRTAMVRRPSNRMLHCTSQSPSSAAIAMGSMQPPLPTPIQVQHSSMMMGPLPFPSQVYGPIPYHLLAQSNHDIGPLHVPGLPRPVGSFYPIVDSPINGPQPNISSERYDPLLTGPSDFSKSGG